MQYAHGWEASAVGSVYAIWNFEWHWKADRNEIYSELQIKKMEESTKEWMNHSNNQWFVQSVIQKIKAQTV